eukprot:TRINITY_DN9225_c0_g1_i1.p1 TRINITY_DN9225_c0_g1~~TRINITY_DN9225_c0_g1_i1.p1  ORF type:complete len:156 (+),score=28.93 TRINITY_DN9225_c0_g1_i1:270-737(+)
MNGKYKGFRHLYGMEVFSPAETAPDSLKTFLLADDQGDHARIFWICNTSENRVGLSNAISKARDVLQTIEMDKFELMDHKKRKEFYDPAFFETPGIKEEKSYESDSIPTFYDDDDEELSRIGDEELSVQPNDVNYYRDIVSQAFEEQTISDAKDG